MAELSYWFREVPDEKRFPSLKGDLRVDATVIGGGIAGISAAYFLSRAGFKTALIEMNHLVTGDSGYTTAFATHFLDSTEATLKAWSASEAGISLFHEVIKKEKIECEWMNVDGIGFSRKENLDDFRNDYQAFRSVDSTIEYFERKAASAMLEFPVTAAFRKKQEGQLHVRKFLLKLADRAQANGGLFFEESEVREIAIGSPVLIRTERGSITTDWLIVATGPPSQQFFPEASRLLSGAITYVIQATYGTTKPFGQSLFWDDLEPYHYFRWISDTELILGGEDRWLKEKMPASNPHHALAEWLKEISGEVSFTVTNKWQGTIFSTPDILPFVAPHKAYGERVIFLTGWAGNGMVHGMLAGAMAADMVQRKENPHQMIFSFDR